MKIVGIDLDGTLLNSQQTISPKNAATLKQLPPTIFPFICSGRETQDIAHLLAKQQLELPIVGLNGANGFNHGHQLFEFALQPKIVPTTYQLLATYPTKLYSNQGIFESPNYKQTMRTTYATIGQAFAPDSLDYLLDYEKTVQSIPFTNINAVLAQPGIKIYKFFIYLANLELKKTLLAQLAQISGITATESAADNLEIMPSNVTKGLAFQHIETAFGFQQPTRVAIGDGRNDLSMFEAADIGFSMADSDPVIHKIADYTTTSNDADGVAEALLRLMRL